MVKDLNDPKNWANPRLGAIVLGAWNAAPVDQWRCDYRSCSMSAQELMDALKFSPNYYRVQLSEDRVWMQVTLNASTRGASVCSFGYLDNQVGKVSSNGFWTRWQGGDEIYHAL